MLANIDLEGTGSPSPKSLDVIIGAPLRRKERSTARAEGVPPKGVGEERMEAPQIPRTCGDRQRGVQPQVREVRGTGVATVKILREDREGVRVEVGVRHDEDDIPLKEPVGLVTREMIREPVRKERDRSTQNTLAGRLLRG